MKTILGTPSSAARRSGTAWRIAPFCDTPRNLTDEAAKKIIQKAAWSDCSSATPSAIAYEWR
jgi:hypothetical protein